MIYSLQCVSYIIKRFQKLFKIGRGGGETMWEVVRTETVSFESNLSTVIFTNRALKSECIIQIVFVTRMNNIAFETFENIPFGQLLNDLSARKY